MRLRIFTYKALLIGAFFFSLTARAQIFKRSALWPTGSTIIIHFVDGTERMMEFVEKSAQEWEKHVNLDFVFIRDNPRSHEKSDIRISFYEPGNWSLLGTEAIEDDVTHDEVTMSLSILLSSQSDELKKSYVLHEFGHMLGLLHEHQNPRFPYTRNVVNISNWCDQRNHYRGEDSCLENFLGLKDLLEDEIFDFDEKSIMLYPLKKEFTLEEIEFERNYGLSLKDIEFAKTYYP